MSTFGSRTSFGHSTLEGSIGIEFGGSSAITKTSASEKSVSVSTTITMASAEENAVVNNDVILVRLIFAHGCPPDVN